MAKKILIVLTCGLMTSFGPLAVGASSRQAGGRSAPARPGAFDTSLKPFLQTYCYGCHSGSKPAADKTRIATLLMCRDISGLFYPFLDVKLAHHLASHEDTGDPFMRINQFYVSQYVYLIQKLAAMPEGDRTVLDNSCLVFMSNMWSGSQHDSTKVPVLTAGTLGGTLETGRVLDYTTAGDENRKLCSFYLSLMDRMGVTLDRFGDADQRLRGI